MTLTEFGVSGATETCRIVYSAVPEPGNTYLVLLRGAMDLPGNMHEWTYGEVTSLTSEG